MKIRNGVCLIVLAAVSTGYSAVVNIDFQPGGASNSTTYAGTAAAPDSGTVWNGIAVTTDGAFGPAGGFLASGLNGAPLVDSLGSPSSMTVSVTNGNASGGSWNAAYAAPTGVGVVVSAEYDLMREYLISSNAGSKTVTLGGLDAATFYTLYLYGAGDNRGGPDDGSNRSTIFTVIGLNSGFGSTSFAEPSNGLTLGEEYTMVSGIQSTLAGTITIEYARNGSAGEGVFNGLQIVPEPSTGLLLLGAAGIAVSRRRRCAR